MTTQDQLNSFHNYASQRIVSGTRSASIEELFDEWRYQNLEPHESIENVEAIREAIEDMNRGDKGRDARSIVAELLGEIKPHTEE